MEKKSWVLDTNGNLETRVQKFLKSIWQEAGLDGMVVAVYGERGTKPGPKLLTSQEDLQQADPFIPLMPVNTSKIVEQIAQDSKAGRYGAVLRSCEARALAQRIRNTDLSLADWLIVGVDCLASYSTEDFDWRVERAGDAEHLTQEVLRNARQGGISADRFRSGCQMCVHPEAQLADICIGIIGMPVREYAMVTVRSEQLAEELKFERITEGRAPEWLVEQHNRVLALMIERHKRVRERVLDELEAGLPEDVEAWLAHLENCDGCEACMDACPLYSGQVVEGKEAVVEWLAGCVSCGMCEQACPQHLPITALIRRIVESMHEEVAQPQ